MGTNDKASLLPGMAVFVRVVEAGSFSAAARQLGSTASAVSRQVARLEQALSLRLMERTTRQLRLNEAGSEFYAHCRTMLDAADQALAVGERLMSSPRGLVRLSVPKAYGKFVISPLMPEFLRRYDDVDVQLHISDQSPDLIEEGFDLLVQVTNQPPEGLAGKPLGPVRQLLCASPAYLQQHGTPQHPQELLRHSCLYLGENAGDNRWHFSNGEQQEVVTVRGRYISNHSEARLEAALGDIGITVLPQFTAARALEQGRLSEVLPRWRYTGSYQGAAWLLWRQNLHLPPKQRVLIDYLSETLAPR
ncbi:LysR family transcriptional regulator [Stutzerimonas xanthomarina]|uniref:DNA-binding transcriptional regulator, LysR family n=2 Tax=Stutzerimonas xanthomarina TaxID=271420 RepID=A0A1M5L0C4_9GAMM|nr:LysR family transcriptional regulator [Stutzerimonas xanthomarina]MCP9337406.1 LysR family transcriptional regulator [Stutzerimonas xanthomarina]SEH49955.1 DNA-binding transcriptional regulator, LysR family [Stutzerimonas xanthomarina]SHG58415.1 DNA-binding transcriptional regulator, LysR family [Stutzerimonas xanthomarina DSM 18231]